MDEQDSKRFMQEAINLSFTGMANKDEVVGEIRTGKVPTFACPDFPDHLNIKGSFRPCNGYVVVLKNHGHDGILFGVYDIRKKKMIVLCDFSDVVFDRESGYIKAFDKVKTLTYDLYDIHGHRVRTWEQIDSSR